MSPTHRRALCPHCNRVCEQRSTTELVGGQAVPSRTCIECLTTYADDPRDEQPDPVVANGCPLCGGEVIRRIVRDPSGAELPATDCVDCEQLCLSARVASDRDRLESARNLALDQHCTALAASLRERDREVRTLESQLVELDAKLRAAEVAKEALSAQLLLAERKVASLPPPNDTIDELSRELTEEIEAHRVTREKLSKAEARYDDLISVNRYQRGYSEGQKEGEQRGAEKLAEFVRDVRSWNMAHGEWSELEAMCNEFGGKP